MPKIISKIQNIFKSQETSEKKENLAASTPTAPQEIPTKPLSQLYHNEVSSPPEKQLNAGYGQSSGRQRDHNEDAR